MFHAFPVSQLPDFQASEHSERMARVLAKIFAERGQLFVVHATLNDAVDFDREPERCRSGDAAQSARDTEAESVELAGGRVVERIDGDVEPVKSRGVEHGRE